MSCSDLSWFRQCRNSTKSYKDYVYKVSHSFKQLAKVHVTHISLLLHNTQAYIRSSKGLMNIAVE